MPDAVISISYDTSPKTIRSLLHPGIKFVHVSLEPEGEAELNLIRLARKNVAAKNALVELTKFGFHIYLTKDNVSRLARHDVLGTLWIKVKDGEYRITSEGIVYSFTPPHREVAPKRLLVVFSSIHEDMYTSSLMRHFMQNFPSIQKYIPSDTAVLRIADLGGVAGSFYLDSSYLSSNTSGIQELLASVSKANSIGHDSIVLYGVSKGGTGALYHAMKGGYRCVSVDPIVSDQYYEEKYMDSHFTANGLFPVSKQEVFKLLAEEVVASSSVMPGAYSRWSVICSEHSPQFKYITDILVNVLMDSVSFFNSRNAQIKDHPDVGPRTVNAATMLINMQLYGVPLRAGMIPID